MLVIALTGGIGSGKSTVSNIFKSKNIPIIDTDEIARQIVEPNEPAYNKIVKQFGHEILNNDKTLNRQLLRKMIFSSEEKKLLLENILHPIIWREVKSQLSLLTSSSSEEPAYCIVVIPLLLENPSTDKSITFDRILVVDVDEDTQIARATTRDNCDNQTVKKIINSQVSRQKRLEAADDVLINMSNLAELSKYIDDLDKKYTELAKSK